MTESKIPRRDPQTAGLDTRLAELEAYLAGLPQQKQKRRSFSNRAGGTVVHLRHVGSFHFSHDSASRVALAVAGLAVVALLILCFRRSAPVV